MTATEVPGLFGDDGAASDPRAIMGRAMHEVGHVGAGSACRMGSYQSRRSGEGTQSFRSMIAMPGEAVFIKSDVNCTMTRAAGKLVTTLLPIRAMIMIAFGVEHVGSVYLSEGLDNATRDLVAFDLYASGGCNLFTAEDVQH